MKNETRIDARRRTTLHASRAALWVVSGVLTVPGAVELVAGSAADSRAWVVISAVVGLLMIIHAALIAELQASRGVLWLATLAFVLALSAVSVVTGAFTLVAFERQATVEAATAAADASKELHIAIAERDRLKRQAESAAEALSQARKSAIDAAAEASAQTAIASAEARSGCRELCIKAQSLAAAAEARRAAAEVEAESASGELQTARAALAKAERAVATHEAALGTARPEAALAAAGAVDQMAAYASRPIAWFAFLVDALILLVGFHIAKPRQAEPSPAPPGWPMEEIDAPEPPRADPIDIESVNIGQRRRRHRPLHAADLADAPEGSEAKSPARKLSAGRSEALISHASEVPQASGGFRGDRIHERKPAPPIRETKPHLDGTLRAIRDHLGAHCGAPLTANRLSEAVAPALNLSSRAVRTHIRELVAAGALASNEGRIEIAAGSTSGQRAANAA